MEKYTVFIDGDPTIDWAVNLPDRHVVQPEDRLKAPAAAHWHWGGVFLLSDLVRRALSKESETNVEGPTPPDICPQANDPHMHHSYNTIQYLPPNDDRKKAADGAAWRIKDFIGFNHFGESLERLWNRKDPKERKRALGETKLIVIDDAGLGFGHESHKGWWADLIQHDDAWMILKIRGTSLEHGLWSEVQHLLAQEQPPQTDQSKNAPASLNDRLIVVITADNLRDANAEISRGLSWEQSTQDLLTELRENKNLKGLEKCRRLIVTFGPTGALFIDRTIDSQPSHTLLFNKSLMEGSWDREHPDGSMFGYGSVLTAAVTRSLTEPELPPTGGDGSLVHDRVIKGIKHGIRAMETAYKKGFEGFKRNTDEPSKKSEKQKKEGSKFTFPLSCMDVEEKKEGGEADEEISQCDIPEADTWSTTTWSILSGILETKNPFEEAKKIVLEGRKVLRNVPTARFNDLLTVDRDEIEELRGMQNLITEYWEHREKKKPRSIAVFGAPGDGKSFAVKQVIKSLQKEQSDPLEFNLSQFNSVDDLAEAFHNVRDRVLKYEVPFVFWDEFDTPFQGQPLGWLRYFLAPMQDGVFQQGQIQHPIGRCFFVFAGSIWRCYETFREKAREDELANAKGEDFISRLRGYLDVIGPNPKPGMNIKNSPHRLIHRALLLDHFLKNAKIGTEPDGRNVKMVEDGVVNAFLEIDEYYHGTRSMEAIIDMSRLHAGCKFGRSMLPPPAQLSLHVDATKFLSIARQRR